MEFSAFLLAAFLTTVTGQWSASVIPMVPNSGSLRSGMMPQGIQPVNSFRMDQMSGFQNYRPVNTFPLNSFGNYGPMQQQNSFVPMQQQNSFASMQPNPIMPMQQNPYMINQGFPMMSGGFANHPRALGASQYVPTAVNGFSQNSKPQEVQKTHSEGSLPKFLEGADEITIKEFKRIIRQPNMTYENKIKQVDELVQTLDDSKQLLYQQFMKEGDQNEQKRRDEIHKTVAVMSDDAQKTFAKISAILTNPQLPEEERWSRILTIYGNIDPKLRSEFEEKFKPLV